MKPDSRFLRLRAVVRTFTSPRRVWFWTTTLPVLLAPVALCLVMRPGVEFHRSVKVGAVEASVDRVDFPDVVRQGTAGLDWRGGSVSAGCVVPVVGRPAWPVDPAIHRLGPLVWGWQPGVKWLGIDAHWFGLMVGVSH